MRAADDYRIARQRDIHNRRPDAPGLYLGLGSQIWCWAALAELGAVDAAEADQRSLALAELLPESLAATDESELLKGRAGAIIALLGLADRTADSRWLDLAVTTGEQLVELADTTEGRSRWPAPLWPAGIGGLAHGATGIGWALARLGQVAGRDDFTAAADAAFAFEESLWSPADRNWRDIRWESGVGTAWCHGATGIGLAAADLLDRGVAGAADHADVLRRAADACWRNGLGNNHTVCHGDLGCWELLMTAAERSLAPTGFDPIQLTGYIVSSIEQHGFVAGLIRSAFVPGLMPGSGGIAYQLLRMDPACQLPSILLLG
jgi:lantibiotic modifying enzyme